MTQLTLNIENKSLVPILKKLISELNGVTIAPPVRKSSRKEKTEKFLKELNEIRDSIDTSLIDLEKL